MAALRNTKRGMVFAEAELRVAQGNRRAVELDEADYKTAGRKLADDYERIHEDYVKLVTKEIHETRSGRHGHWGAVRRELQRLQKMAEVLDALPDVASDLITKQIEQRKGETEEVEILETIRNPEPEKIEDENPDDFEDYGDVQDIMQKALAPKPKKEN